MCINVCVYPMAETLQHCHGHRKCRGQILFILMKTFKKLSKIFGQFLSTIEKLSAFFWTFSLCSNVQHKACILFCY